MKKVLKGATLWLAAMVIFSAASHAAESDLVAQMADMGVKMAAMEAKLADGPANRYGEPEATSLLSMRRGDGQTPGAIQIGGEVNIDVIWKSRDDVTSDTDNVDSTTFRTNSANLNFKISATADSYLMIKLDLDDAFDDNRLDGIADQDDLLEEVRFVWNHIRGSNWGIVFGKGEVPYGQDRTLGIIQSYHHNDQVYSSEGPVFLVAGTEEAADPQDFSLGNPHANVGNTSKPGEVDNVFQAQVNYKYKGWLKWEFAVYQNNDTTGRGAPGRGMHEDRPDDNLLFQSMATRLWILPTEDLTIELSFIRKYIDSFGDVSINTSFASAESYAANIGFNYIHPTAPIEFFGEYARGWNWNYTDDYNVNVYQLGLIWHIKNDLSIGVMGEHLNINDDRVGSEENWYKGVVSLKRTFNSGIYSILEYGFEQYNASLVGADDRDAHLIAFRTGWMF